MAIETLQKEALTLKAFSDFGGIKCISIEKGYKT